MLKQLYAWCLAVFFLSACSSGHIVNGQSSDLELVGLDSSKQRQRGEIIHAERIASLSLDELRRQFSSLPEPRYPVQLYRIVYRSQDIKGKAIAASGLLAIPDGKQSSFPLIAAQHGTISSQSSAPSNRPRQGIWEASQGFVTAVQDYIGFGSAADYSHPYLVPEAYVATGLDIIRASRQFAETHNIQLSALFLAGYSEGGYACLAIQRAIETDRELRREFLESSFRLLASAPGAGPYNLSLTAVRSLEQEQVHPVYMMKVVKAYREIYPAIDADYAVFFQPAAFGVEDAASLQAKIDQDLLSGRLDVRQILGQVSSVTKELIQKDYLQLITAFEFDEKMQIVNAERDTTGLTSQLDRNNLTLDWSPQIPTRLSHCINDEVIPVEVSTSAVALFQSFYAKSPVEAVIIDDPNFSHSNCPAAISPIEWFTSFIGEKS